jgi:hypothetical protein
MGRERHAPRSQRSNGARPASDFLGKPRYSVVSDQGLVKKLRLNLFESLASIL